jgi:signal transduction histidine kinase
LTLAGGIADAYFRIHGHPWSIAATGAAILVYNVFFRATLGLMRGRTGRMLVLCQIAADLLCLVLLIGWTGGGSSPLMGFVAFHMVFASLLLPRVVAFGVAGGTFAVLAGFLAAGGGIDPFFAIGLCVTLLATVYLTTRITADLRRKQRRLVKLTRRLKEQQRAMVQQEKIVALGQMAAGIAHEVANPLASMDGLLQLMERRPEKATAESIGRLREQVARVNAIVRQLTTFARPGEQEGPWVEGSVNEVVLRALELLRFDRRLKHVAVTRSLDPHLPVVRMLPSGLEQVVINLVINACDALEGRDGGTLELRTQVRDGAVELLVIDNGPGVPESLREKIFEPFFTTKPPGKGTGLGLSISHSIVRRHGGRMELRSEPGRTEVCVRLVQTTTA